MSDRNRPDRKAVDSAQLDQLRRLIAALLRSNRFYGPRLGAAGLDGELASLEQFRLTMPTTRKTDVVADQRQHPPFGTNLTFELDRYTRLSQTSATTAAPLRWLDTPESWTWMLDNWARVFEASGVGPGDRVFFAFSFGPFLGFWTAFESAARLGCLCIPGGGMSSAARLHTILNNGATALCCTPTYAIHLGEAAAELSLDLSESKVKAIIVAGEAGGSVSATRATIERLWPGAVVYDHHGMTEVGPVSYQCTSQTGVLHVIESAFLAEVIEPDSPDPGTPVARANEGELVLTTLGRTASPLLRYRTGDIVRVAAAEKCTCGGLDVALEGGILGRTDDMIQVRGVNIFPSAVDQIVRAAGGITEYRVQIKTSGALCEMKIQIEPQPSFPDVTALCARLQRELHNAFALRVPVEPVAAGQLPRYEMKAKRWLRDGG